MAKRIANQLANLDEQKRKLREKEKELEERRKALMREQSQQNRKRRNHALMTMGGLIESCFSDGWTSIDFDALEALIKQNSGLFEGACATENLPEDEATERLREWERSVREQETIEKQQDAKDVKLIEPNNSNPEKHPKKSKKKKKKSK